LKMEARERERERERWSVPAIVDILIYVVSIFLGRCCSWDNCGTSASQYRSTFRCKFLVCGCGCGCMCVYCGACIHRVHTYAYTHVHVHAILDVVVLTRVWLTWPISLSLSSMVDRRWVFLSLWTTYRALESNFPAMFLEYALCTIIVVHYNIMFCISYSLEKLWKHQKSTFGVGYVSWLYIDIHFHLSVHITGMYMYGQNKQGVVFLNDTFIVDIDKWEAMRKKKASLIIFRALVLFRLTIKLYQVELWEDGWNPSRRRVKRSAFLFGSTCMIRLLGWQLTRTWEITK
jgi:hypothetical protein